MTSRKRQRASMALGVILGFAIVAGARVSPMFPVLIVPALVTYVLLHEAGHVIAGICTGFRILMFSVWPLTLRRSGKSWTVKFAGKAGMAGFVAADPVTPIDLRRRYLLFIAGGPVATLATAIAAGVCAALLPQAAHEWLYGWLNALALLSAMAFVGGLIPSAGNATVNDAARIRMLWRNGPEGERTCALSTLGAASISGVRPRDLNPEMVAKLPGPNDGTRDWIGGQLLRYNVMVDSGQSEEAFVTLKSVLDGALPSEVREVLSLQAACFESRVRRDLGAARQWLAAKPLRKRRDENYRNTLLRAQAGIALLEGRLDDAERDARESLAYCDQLLDLGSAIVIRESTEELLAEIATSRSSG